MKIIIPMAGRGSRLRPHTLTTPKPLLPIAGKPMVQRLVEDFNASFPGQINEVAFIIGDFGAAVEQQLHSIAEGIGARARIYHQDQPLGPAHAIYCAQESLEGPCIIAFSDTLFKAKFSIPSEAEGIIWAQKVDNPSSFGVLKVDGHQNILGMVEKPDTFVSDLAIVGIYYFREAKRLREEIKYLLDNEVKEKNEYQLTSALENLRQKDHVFKVAQIEEWLDCGNMENVLQTNRRILELKKEEEQLVDPSAVQENVIIHPPCFIGKKVHINNVILGPYVSIGEGSVVENSIVKNSIIQKHAVVKNGHIDNSMIGQHVEYEGKGAGLSLGDYSKV